MNMQCCRYVPRITDEQTNIVLHKFFYSRTRPSILFFISFSCIRFASCFLTLRRADQTLSRMHSLTLTELNNYYYICTVKKWRCNRRNWRQTNNNEEEKNASNKDPKPLIKIFFHDMLLGGRRSTPMPTMYQFDNWIVFKCVKAVNQEKVTREKN